MKSHPRATLLLAGCLIALSACLTGCGSGDGTPSGTPTADPSHGSSASVQEGDCRVESATGLPADAEVVPCTEAHDEEVFLSIEMTEQTFSQAAVDAASAACIGDAFTDYVGVPNTESALHVYTIAPTSDTWDDADGRRIHCVLFDPAGSVEGTLAGSAR